MGADTNPTRNTVAKENTFVDVKGTDALLQLELDANVRGHVGRTTWTARATTGGKAFASLLTTDSMAAFRLDAAAITALPNSWQMAWRTSTKGRLQPTLTRTYLWHHAEWAMSTSVHRRLRIEGGLSGGGFASWQANAATFSSAGAFAGALWFASAKETLATRLSTEGRGFVAMAPRARPDEPQAPGYAIRLDTPVMLTATWTSTRTVFTSLRYMGTWNLSNSFGEGYLRHRLVALVGVALPAEFTLSADVGLQFTTYTDGLLGDGQRRDLQLADESQNRLVIRLRRPLLPHTQLEVRASVFGNEFSDASQSFARMVLGVGLSGDLGWTPDS